jgi:hypothetical protein
MNDLDRVKELAGLLTENDYSSYREAEFGNKVNDVLNAANELKHKLDTLPRPPSVERQHADAMKAIIAYLTDLRNHVDRNLRR